MILVSSESRLALSLLAGIFDYLVCSRLNAWKQRLTFDDTLADVSKKKKNLKIYQKRK